MYEFLDYGWKQATATFEVKNKISSILSPSQYLRHIWRNSPQGFPEILFSQRWYVQTDGRTNQKHLASTETEKHFAGYRAHFTHRVKIRQTVGGALPTQEELLWGMKRQPNVHRKLQKQEGSRQFPIKISLYLIKPHLCSMCDIQDER